MRFLIPISLLLFSGLGAPKSAAVLKQNRICAAEFDGSRVCTSLEILDTVNPPVPAADFPGAWVRPVLQKIANADNLDASGVVNVGQFFQCTTASNLGLMMQPDESFALADCGSVLPVACCALVP